MHPLIPSGRSAPKSMCSLVMEAEVGRLPLLFYQMFSRRASGRSLCTISRTSFSLLKGKYVQESLPCVPDERFDDMTQSENRYPSEVSAFLTVVFIHSWE
jgi:hypothetical protein